MTNYLKDRHHTPPPLPPLTSPNKEDAKVNHNSINAAPKPHTNPCQSQIRRDVFTVQYCQPLPPTPPTRMGLGAGLSLKNDETNEMVTIWSDRLIIKMFRLLSRDTRVSGLTGTPSPNPQPPPTRMGLGAGLSLKNDETNEMVTIWSDRLIIKMFRLLSRDTRVSGLTGTPLPTTPNPHQPVWGSVQVISEMK